MPVRGGAPAADASDEQLASAAGADLLLDTPEILAWLQDVIGRDGRPPVVGMCVRTRTALAATWHV